MERERLKEELERDLHRYRELAQQFPDGPMGDLLRELIRDVEAQIAKRNALAR